MSVTSTSCPPAAEELISNEEGCLSIPGYYAEVKRPRFVNAEWQNIEGENKKKKCTGLLSICLQHEIDHLNGKLFIDYLSNLKKKRALEKVKKINKKNNEKVK